MASSDDLTENLKARRRAAYLAAREKQKSDPKYIAMKQRQREVRREAYQKLKESRKAYAKAMKAKQHDEKLRIRTERNAALMGMLTTASKIPPRETTDDVSQWAIVTE